MTSDRADSFAVMQHVYDDEQWRDLIPMLRTGELIGWSNQEFIEEWFLMFSHEMCNEDVYEIGVACDLSLCHFIHDDEFMSFLHNVSLRHLDSCVKRQLVSPPTARLYIAEMKHMQRKLKLLVLD